MYNKLVLENRLRLLKSTTECGWQVERLLSVFSGQLPRHFASWIVLISLLAVILVPLYGSPLTVNLRLMDARSGRPLKGIKVEIFTWVGEARTKAEGQKTKRVKGQAVTDEDGRTTFQLPEPLPQHMGFLLVPPDDFGGCWGQDFSPEEVLRSGTVANFAPKCGKLKWQASAKPGEVVIFEKKLTSWEKMRREIP